MANNEHSPKQISRRKFLELAGAAATGALLAAYGAKPTPDPRIEQLQQQVAQLEAQLKAQAAADTPVAGDDVETIKQIATATAPQVTENPLNRLPQEDLDILAKVGNLHRDPNWQEKLTGEYKGWTGIAVPYFNNGQIEYYGLFAGNQIKRMPADYTPERNPVTQAAWPGVNFPEGYFGGYQPLNAPDLLPDGRPTVNYRAYWPNKEEHTAPYDLYAWGNTFAFAQGTNLRIGDNYNSGGAAFTLAVPKTSLHLWITEGEVDGINMPNGISAETAYLLARTWFGGFLASTAANQQKQHGDFINAPQIMVRNGLGLQQADVTYLWRPR